MSRIASLITASLAVLTLAIAVSWSAPARAQTASIEMQIYKAGFIVGVSGGEGVLYHQGRAYPLSIGGVSLGATIGASKADLVGEVYNLRAPQDIQGIYQATRSGYAVAGGETGASLQNSVGVVLEVRGKQVGLEFSIDLSGMQISLQ